MKIASIVMAAVTLAACTASPELRPEPKANLLSPDSKLRMEFSMTPDGTPCYALWREDIDRTDRREWKGVIYSLAP